MGDGKLWEVTVVRSQGSGFSAGLGVRHAYPHQLQLNPGHPYYFCVTFSQPQVPGARFLMTIVSFLSPVLTFCSHSLPGFLEVF